MYKNIIFDLGRVVLNFEPMEYLHEKIKDKKIVLSVFESIFKSEEWQMLDRGIITEDDAKKAIINRNKNNEKYINISFENWYDMLTPIKETVQLINDLKENGYKLYYLSNFHEKAFKEMLKRYEFFKLFDGGVVSYEEKLLKPEKEIYLTILDKYSLKYNECIFIDDTKANVKGAEDINIKGITYIDNKDLIKNLIECNITI